MESYQRWFLVCEVFSLLCIMVTLWGIAGHLSTLVKRSTGLMLAVQELCDRIWELRDARGKR